jgi:hypothetical protein
MEARQSSPRPGSAGAPELEEKWVCHARSASAAVFSSAAAGSWTSATERRRPAQRSQRMAARQASAHLQMPFVAHYPLQQPG